LIEVFEGDFVYRGECAALDRDFGNVGFDDGFALAWGSVLQDVGEFPAQAVDRFGAGQAGQVAAELLEFLPPDGELVEFDGQVVTMTPATGTDLACFGYLAYAQVFGVTAYPAANSGTQVTQIIPSLAGDAPIAALTARQLGSHVSLVSNPVQPRPSRTRRPAHPRHHRRVTSSCTRRDVRARHPQLTIVTDDAGTRTWFAWLAAAIDQLTDADPTPLASARLAYIDCYRIIDLAAAAAITANRVPLLLNLGGDRLSEAVACAAKDRHVAFVQTNLDEAHADQAQTLAAQLHERICADTIVITLGRLGAFARTPTGTIRATAPSMAIRHTHGAGAAFSGGLAHAHLAGAGLAEALQSACAVATAHCAAARHIPRQRLATDLIKENLT
jgi:hypothetical protein